MNSEKKRVAVLISGRGSNMASLIAAAREADYPAEIVGVVSNKPDAKGLEAAAAAGIAAHVIARADFADKAAQDAALDAALREMGAEIVCLAGYMRILTRGFVEEWAGRMINIHPSLLPLFKGLDAHSRALDAGMRIHGCTVHFVTPEMDDGPIIAQAAVPVLPDDTPDTLAARVLTMEHRLYPLALSLVASGKARMEGGRTVFGADGDIGWGERSALLAPSSIETAFNIEDLARRTP